MNSYFVSKTPISVPGVPSNTLACVRISPRKRSFIRKEFVLMKRYTKSLAAMTLLALLAACGPEPAAKEAGGNSEAAVADTSIYFGARIIPGDGSPVLEDMSIITSH